MENAEQAAVSVTQEVTTLPKYYASSHINLFTDDGKLVAGSREMFLTGNRHFDHIAVNLSLSAILMPAEIKDTGNFIIQLVLKLGNCNDCKS
jgi:hypothetical protein